VIAKTRLDATADRAKVKDWINRVYARVCVETEALQRADTMTLTANVASYTLPGAVIRIKWLVSSTPGGSYGAPLQSTSQEQILVWRQTGTVAPVALMYYVYLPSPLSLDTDVPVIQEPYATDALEYGACFEAAAFKGDPAAGDWHSLYQDSKSRLIQHLSRRSGGGTGQLRVAGAMPVRLRRDIDTGA
jgi:hypothetical protein